MAWKFALPLIALLALGACNTMQGVGQDVTAAGEALESEAAATQEAM